MHGLVDTHCHVTDPKFDADRDEVLCRAARSGVRRVVAVGGGGPIELSEAAADLAARAARGMQASERRPADAQPAAWPELRATAGMHPHDAKDYDDAVEARVVRLLARPEVVAVGETGLDYYYEHSPRDVQKRALARQLALARTHALPIVLHCRDAEADLRDVLKSEAPGELRGVVHCFTGTYDDARWYVDKGLLVSFTGILTFKTADALREVARKLPLDRLMIETDAPYLAPIPHRGKRNEPAFVAHTAQALADARSISVEEVADRTSATAAALFFGENG